MKRVLLAAVAILVLAVAATFLSRRQESTAPPPPTARADGAEIGRGEYLALVGDCLACHTVRGGKPYAGGLELPTPFGKLYTPNITPDPETGIGKWTADDFRRAMHEGLSKDGSYLYPAFPYNNYTRVTRADVDAIYAFFMSLPPVSQPNKPHEMRFPYNQRQLLLGWRTLYFKAGEFKPNPGESAEWNRGAYLVEGLGHCNACHGTRNMLGAVKDDDVGGGLIPVQNWYAPSLTSNRETGLGDWQVRDIVDLLRTGVSARGAVFGPMSAVVAHSLQNVTLGDLTAMSVYLKAQAEKAAPAAAVQVRPSEQQAGAMLKQGARLYEKHCADCHGADGAGVPRVYPPLAKNRSILMEYSINPIRMVLVGGFPPSTEGNPRPYGMPPFAYDLNDQEIAAVVTYIRQSWGNSASAVSPIEVGAARGVKID
jgi:mono/diheme cytochrome c family protein